LLVIGDEILSGRTQDKNVAQIAAWLNVQGIRLAEVRVVPDVEAAIVEAVNALRARNDYLFTTGGIGPTHDDITVDAIAAALGVPVVVHPGRARCSSAIMPTRGGLTEARLRMARVPEGADLIENRMSGAPGIRIGNIFILAGVPHITAGMLDALTGTLEGGRRQRWLSRRTIGCWVPRARSRTCSREVERAHEGVAIGSYPFFRDGRTARISSSARPNPALGDDRVDDEAQCGDEDAEFGRAAFAEPLDQPSHQEDLAQCHHYAYPGERGADLSRRPVKPRDREPRPCRGVDHPGQIPPEQGEGHRQQARHLAERDQRADRVGAAPLERAALVGASVSGRR
jgi:molybdenum cofactor synthesis domain-containing protein